MTRIDPAPRSVDTAATYLAELTTMLERIRTTQTAAIERAAAQCASTIEHGGLVHVFGSGHSRIITEEVWPRYGSFPGFNPIVELSVTSYHHVTGPNGLRQVMFIENVTGLAATVAAGAGWQPGDSLIAISAGGTTVVTVELAELARAAGLPVIAITSVTHSQAATARHPGGHRLLDVADIVLDTCTPIGDASITIDGLDAPVGPTTTVAAAALANAVKVRVAEKLVAVGIPPKVLVSPAVVGAEAAAKALDEAMDEHARLSRRSTPAPFNGQ